MSGKSELPRVMLGNRVAANTCLVNDEISAMLLFLGLKQSYTSHHSIAWVWVRAISPVPMAYISQASGTSLYQKLSAFTVTAPGRQSRTLVSFLRLVIYAAQYHHNKLTRNSNYAFFFIDIFERCSRLEINRFALRLLDTAQTPRNAAELQGFTGTH